MAVLKHVTKNARDVFSLLAGHQLEQLESNSANERRGARRKRFWSDRRDCICVQLGVVLPVVACASFWVQEGMS